jgi:hypothetical protein
MHLNTRTRSEQTTPACLVGEVPRGMVDERVGHCHAFGTRTLFACLALTQQSVGRPIQPSAGSPGMPRPGRRRREAWSRGYALWGGRGASGAPTIGPCHPWARCRARAGWNAAPPASTGRVSVGSGGGMKADARSKRSGFHPDDWMGQGGADWKTGTCDELHGSSGTAIILCVNTSTKKNS